LAIDVGRVKDVTDVGPFSKELDAARHAMSRSKSLEIGSKAALDWALLAADVPELPRKVGNPRECLQQQQVALPCFKATGVNDYDVISSAKALS
jgi:hypothetical protein